jgi:hypothetical protein
MVNKKQQNMQLLKSVTFSYTKGQEISMGEARKKYFLRIPEQLASNVSVDIEILSGQAPLGVSITAEKELVGDVKNEIRKKRSIPYTIIDNPQSLQSNLAGKIVFPKDERDFICDLLLFACHTANFNSTIKFTIRCLNSL